MCEHPLERHPIAGNDAFSQRSQRDRHRPTPHRCADSQRRPRSRSATGAVRCAARKSAAARFSTSRCNRTRAANSLMAAISRRLTGKATVMSSHPWADKIARHCHRRNRDRCHAGGAEPFANAGGLVSLEVWAKAELVALRLCSHARNVALCAHGVEQQRRPIDHFVDSGHSHTPFFCVYLDKTGSLFIAQRKPGMAGGHSGHF
jgi:hypothetical protein